MKIFVEIADTMGGESVKTICIKVFVNTLFSFSEKEVF